MEIKDIINEGRPNGIEKGGYIETYWHKIGVHDGYEYALKELEEKRLKACKNLSDEEFEREADFVCKFVKEHHRSPMISDAIEATRKQMIDKACKWIEYYNNNGGCLFDGWKDDLVKTMEG